MKRAAGWLAVGALAILALGACPSRRVRQVPSKDVTTSDERDPRGRIKAELEDQILTSYERDEPPDIDTAMVDPRIGAARIGVGPGDVLVGADLARAPSRWPLDVDPRTPTEARSKRLEIHLAQDGTAAWAFDEISWRVRSCGRTAAIPLRMTALFAREGDRWIGVFEHLSFGRLPAPALDGKLRGTSIRSAVASSDLVDELSGVLAQAQLGAKRAPAAIATGPEAVIVGPDIYDEWHARDVLTSNLAMFALRAEDRRVGTIGPTPADTTIAYWIGNFVAALPARPGVAAGKARLRASFVFELRFTTELSANPPRLSYGLYKSAPCRRDPKSCGSPRWVLVQGHVSQPVDDGPDASGKRYDTVDLATLVFGTSLISPKPLALTCDDGALPKAKLTAPGAPPPL